MNRIGILDYGCGNILSVFRAFEKIGSYVEIIQNFEKVDLYSHIVIPGVGSFENAMQKLADKKMIKHIKKFAEDGKSILGICVGMQVLLTESYEFGRHQGLGLISGKVDKINNIKQFNNSRKVPHIGWNKIVTYTNLFKFNAMNNNSFYFVHSFSAQNCNQENIAAETSYAGIKIVAAISQGNILGVQFHPEKSGPSGLKLLENFAK